MRTLTGTSGYSYKEWKGSFYPEDLAATKMLGYYAERLPTVEINNTFYRMPKASVVAGWGEQVPDGFSFVLKASMRITHKKRLADAQEELDYICSTARELGDKLGPLLFQLPPWLKKGVDRLKAFLATVPEDIRAAFEFRHASWFDDEVYDALREAGAALVVSDNEKLGRPPVVATAPFGYVRLRRPAYDAAALDEWAASLKAQPWESVHVFFKHEDDGAGPALAADFATRF
ncbi:MAG: DUF72 domain-containing protein [Planctomycetota bacterium]|jgi:uncharacterized protein YecE (DUF72 family)